MPLAFAPIVRLLSVVAAMLGLATVVSAQQLPQCRLHSLFPPGAQAGTEVEVQVTGGADIDELTQLVFNHPGLSSMPKMREVNGQQEPVPNFFTVKVAGDVPPGFYEVRVAGLYGLSNPRTFVVGKSEEVREVEPNEQTEKAQVLQLNQVVNAKSDRGTDIDYFKFTGKKGQRLLVVCNSSRIDSKLDGVVEVYAASGRRLAVARRSKVWMHGDPVADVTLPADGEYLVKVRDFVYGGGNDYFYRLSVTTTPWIDFVMPPAGQPGTTGQFTFYGRNLPGGQPSDVVVDGRQLEKVTVPVTLPNEPSKLEVEASLDPVQAGVDGIQHTLVSPEGRSNAVMIGFATAPVSLEQEPNNDAPQAQKITVPAEIAGQFQERGDVDTFQFEAKAQEVYYIEVFAQRNGTTADPYFWVEQITKNDKGEEQVKRLQLQDDNPTNIAQNVFDTNTDDPVWKFQVPADGTYRVSVRDRYASARVDPRLVYRLAVRTERPDFRLIVVPHIVVNNNQYSSGAIGLRRGDNYAVPVYVFRRDEFNGTVEVTVSGLPQGVTCAGAVIGPDETSANLIFSATPDAAEWAGRIQVTGKARVDDPAKVRALATAEAAVKPAQDALAKLEQPLQQAEEQLKQATEQLAKAKDALAKQPDNQGLKNQVDAAQKGSDQKQQAATKARQEKAAAEKQVQDALAAVEAARTAKEAAVKEVSHAARSGTVVWDGNQNLPVVSRVSRSVGLSVMHEQASYQLTTEPADVVAHQSTQILVPIKVEKRNGFDADVKLAVAGLPRNANIDLPNVTIPKGSNEALLRFFVKNNAKLGDFTVYLTGQAQVSYSRNPEAAERAKQELASVDEKLKLAQEELNKAKAALDAATKQAQASQEEVKKAKAALDAAQKAKQADDAIAKVKAAVEMAEKAAQAAETAKTQADAALKKSDADFKQSTEMKKQIEQKFKNLENAAKPKNVNLTNPSTPIVVRVKPAPLTLTASVPSGGNIKRGSKLEVKVTAKRQNGVTGPIQLSLPLPPNVQGLSAAAVTIPADQEEGVLVVQAGGDATEGQLENMVIRATAEFDGPASVDAPVTLKVSK